MSINILKILVLIGLNVTLVTCSRILVLFYHHGPSHFYSFYPLFNELAVRGHNVTVLTYSHVNNPHKNYNELLLTELPVLNGTLTYDNMVSNLLKSKHFFFIRCAYNCLLSIYTLLLQIYMYVLAAI